MEKEKRKASIIILSYNTMEITKLCLDSIRRFTEPGTYEIIVIDNASSDGSVNYLQTQSDIKLILNKENMGFPKGCNQGIIAAEENNDILLLNSDTIVTPRWLRQLRTALYSDEKIGAVSCVTNCCSNRQQISVKYTSTAELAQFADTFNRTDEKKWIPFFRLVGFCMLIKRSVVDKIGYLDEAFSPGNYEDDDYSFRIREAGYKLLLCKDTFIHHFGSASFKKHFTKEELAEKQKRYQTLMEKNLNYFCTKWKVADQYEAVDNIVIKKLPDMVADGTKILNITNYYINDIFYLGAKYRNAKIRGILFDKRAAEIANWDNCYKVDSCGDTETEIIVAIEEKYDIVVISQLQTMTNNAERFLERILEFVNEDGTVYFSINDENYVAEKIGER